MSLAILGGNMVGEGGGADQLRAELLSGECIPALAKNLYTEADLEQTGQSFLARTTAGSASVRSGASMLKKLYGAVARTQQKVTESISSSKTDVTSFTVTVDYNAFLAYYGLTTATFTNRETFWVDNNGRTITNLENYGITINGNSIEDDQFIVELHEDGTYDVTYNPASRFSFNLTQATFRAKADESVQKGSSSTFTFEYIVDDTWSLNGSTINLLDYGITVSVVEGEYISGGSEITVNYTRASNGKLEFATPTSLKALGLNSCNCFDPTTMVLHNAAVNASGNIVSSSVMSIAFVKMVYNSSNTNGYTVFDKNNLMSFSAILNKVPAIGDHATISGDVNSPRLRHIEVPISGTYYLLISSSDVSGLCIHPAWSGMEDTTYQAYNESVFNIPTKDDDYNDLVGIGWAVGSYRNTFDFSAKTYTQNVKRMAYSASALAELIAAHPTWVEDTDYSYDNDYIYYHESVAAVNLPATADGIYYCNDYSTEEFVGTSVAPLADFVYGQNLVDKLRSDVVVKNNLVHVTIVYDDDTTETLNMVDNI